MPEIAEPLLRSEGRYRTERTAWQAGAYLLLALTCLAFLYPMALMVVNSFKSDAEMYVNSAGLPLRWTLESYGKIFRYHGGMWINYLNSIIIAVTSTLLSVFLCALAAFAFAKYRFRGRNLLFSLLLATMMVPPEITIPGLYVLFAKLQWINTLRAQILPTITPVLGLFLIRQYMLDIPDSLVEAARIDGAGHFTVFWKVMIPTSAPVLGAFAILQFMSVWNAYTWPVLVATRQQVQPIMVILPQLVDPIIGFLPVWETIMAGCVLSTLPLLIVFVAFQDKFMSSVVIGAIKE
jgi:ABC-type glycerol-3-phosphate transport system permease component